MYFSFLFFFFFPLPLGFYNLKLTYSEIASSFVLVQIHAGFYTVVQISVAIRYKSGFQTPHPHPGGDRRDSWKLLFGSTGPSMLNLTTDP